jgi:hypothetical protein
VIPRYQFLIVYLFLGLLVSVHSLEAQENAAAPIAREEVPPQRQALDQQRREDRARKERQIIFWFSTITAGIIGGIALLFFLVFRAQRAKAIRLQDASLSELWSLSHLSGLAPQAYDLWVLSPPTNSMSAYWTLLSRQDDSVFGLKILRRGRIAEWEGSGPAVHFRVTQDIHRSNGQIEVVVDGEASFAIERTQLLGLGGFRFPWNGDDNHVLYDARKNRMELHRNGNLHAVSDAPGKYSPRVIAIPKDEETALLLIFAYILLLR